MKKIATSLVLTAAAVLGNTVSGNAIPLDGRAFFFGDSLTDCCVRGRTTNGPNWADLLAPQIGKNYTANAQSNYAVGGAQSSGATPSDFLSQVGRFTASGTVIQSNDTAAIWIGTNDIWLSTYTPTDSFNGQHIVGPIGYQPGVSVLVNYILGNIAAGINQLKANGFTNVVLLSPFDLAQSAVEPNASASALAFQYSTALTKAESTFSTPGVNIDFVDVESLLQRVQANPSAYGFEHTTGRDNCAASNCTGQPASVQDTYIFRDVLHLTTAFDRLVAGEAAAVVNAAETPIPEPSSSAMLLAGLASVVLSRKRWSRERASKGA